MKELNRKQQKLDVGNFGEKWMQVALVTEKKKLSEKILVTLSPQN